MNNSIFQRMLDICRTYIISDHVEIFVRGTFSLADMASNKRPMIYRNRYADKVTIQEGNFKCEYSEEHCFSIAHSFAKAHKISTKEIKFSTSVKSVEDDADFVAEFELPKHSAKLVKCVDKDNSRPVMESVVIHLHHGFIGASNGKVLQCSSIPVHIHKSPEGLDENKTEILVPHWDFSKLSGRCKVSAQVRTQTSAVNGKEEQYIDDYIITDEKGTSVEWSHIGKYPSMLNVIPSSYSNHKATIDVTPIRKFTKNITDKNSTLDIFYSRHEQKAKIFMYNEFSETYDNIEVTCKSETSFAIALRVYELKKLLEAWNGDMYVRNNGTSYTPIVLGSKYPNDTLLLMSDMLNLEYDTHIPEDIKKDYEQKFYSIDAPRGKEITFLPVRLEWKHEDTPPTVQPTVRSEQKRLHFWFFIFFDDEEASEVA